MSKVKEEQSKIVTMTFTVSGGVEFSFDNCGSLPLRRVETSIRHLYRALRSEQIKERNRVEGKRRDKIAADSKAEDLAEKKLIVKAEEDKAAEEFLKQENANETMK